MFVGEKLELSEQEPRVEREPLVEDDGGRIVVFGATTGGVLEVEKAVGLGIEAKERNGGISLRCSQLAVEAEQLAEEAEKRAVEGPEEGRLPGGGQGAIPSVGVLQGGGEPEDEVPVRVAASEEVVGDVELGELAVDREPGSLSVAVSEGGVEFDGLCIAAACVETLGVGDGAALPLGVDLGPITAHPGGKVLKRSRPRCTQPRALFRASIGQKMACLSLPEGATSELRRALQSRLKSGESSPRAEVARALPGLEKGERSSVSLGQLVGLREERVSQGLQEAVGGGNLGLRGAELRRGNLTKSGPGWCGPPATW